MTRSKRSKASTSGPRHEDDTSPEVERLRRQYTKQAVQEYLGDDLPFEAIQAVLEKVDPERIERILAGKPDPGLAAELEKMLAASGKPELADRFRKPVPLPEMAKLLQYMPEKYTKRFYDPHVGNMKRLDMDFEKVFGTPEMSAKRERMQVTTIDYDPQSPNYKREIRDLDTPMTILVMDHIEPGAPFAIGGRRKWDAKALMWMLWGDIEDDASTLSNKYQALVVRAEWERVQCLQLYNRHGNNVTRHTKFFDTFYAYLFLTARATTHLHLEQLQQWTILSRAAGIQGWEQVVGLFKKAKERDIGLIGDRVNMARTHLKRGDRELAKQTASMASGDRVRSYLVAAGTYVPALAMLAPYLAMEWYMLPSEDNQGLSEVEIELNLRLAKCAMGIMKLTMVATLHTRAVLRHPFATNEQIAEASLLYSTIVMEEKKTHFDIPLDVQENWIWNAKALAAVAKLRPPKEKWHVQYVEYSLEEKIRRLRGLGAIMPLLFGVLTVIDE